MEVVVWIVMAIISAAMKCVDSEKLFMLVTADGTEFKFTSDDFKEFHECLCSYNTQRFRVDRRDISAWDIGWVSAIGRGTTRKPNNYCSRYSCRTDSDIAGSYLLCNRQTHFSDKCSRTHDCWSYCTTDQSLMCEREAVGIVWEGKVEVQFSYDSGFEETSCEEGCDATKTSSASISITTEEMRTTVKAMSSPSTHSVFDTRSTIARTPQTTSSVASLQVPNNKTDALVDDDGDTKAIIIGGVVSLLVLVALLMVLSVVILKRRRKASHRKTFRASHDDLMSSDSTRSIPLHEVNSTSPIQSRLSTTCKAGGPSYSYASVDLSKKMRRRDDDVNVCDEEDTEYCNQGAIDSSTYNPQSENINNPTRVGGQKGPDYHNMNNHNIDSPCVAITGAASSMQDVTDSDTLENVYSVTDSEDTYCNMDGTCSAINDHSNKRSVLITPSSKRQLSENTMVIQGSNKTNTELPFHNAAASNPGGDYSKLHHVVRNFTNVYNALPAPEGDDVNDNTTPDTRSEYSKLRDVTRKVTDVYGVLSAHENDDVNKNPIPPSSSSTGQAQVVYSETQPIASKSTQPTEITGLGPPSKHAGSNGHPPGSSGISAPADQPTEEAKHLYHNQDLQNSPKTGSGSKETTPLTSSKKRTDYCNVGKNYDLKAGETVEVDDNLTEYSNIGPNATVN